MGKQNRKLLKNIELYEQKKKIEQQKSKIYGQKPVKSTESKEKNTRVYNTQRVKSICSVV